MCALKRSPTSTSRPIEVAVTPNRARVQKAVKPAAMPNQTGRHSNQPTRRGDRATDHHAPGWPGAPAAPGGVVVSGAVAMPGGWFDSAPGMPLGILIGIAAGFTALLAADGRGGRRRIRLVRFGRLFDGREVHVRDRFSAHIAFAHDRL